MFTMKKFAILAAVGFIASSTISCGDDDKDEDNTKPPITFGDGWAKQKNVTLGGPSASEGSFLDVDGDITVYKKNDAIANKSKIDFIFDGANFLTPEGCADNEFCKDVSTNAAIGLAVIPSSLKIDASSKADDVAKAFDDYCFAGGDEPIDDCILSTVAAKKDGKYFLLNAEGAAATVSFIVVNGGVAETVALGVARSKAL